MSLSKPLPLSNAYGLSEAVEFREYTCHVTVSQVQLLTAPKSL